GVDMWLNSLFGWSPFGTMSHGKTDAESVEPASKHKPIEYPKPDGEVTFDRLSSVFMSSTNHEENQPIHLKLTNSDLQKSSEYVNFAGLSNRYCPAGVYEWVDADGNTITSAHTYQAGDDVTFQINAQNCVHCKTCDIKDPNGNITWTVPQGGEGPVYPNM
ncbi:MAG: 4Fe-4S dicluster domain-containing protein, partial [Pseudomonadota bacterium]